MYGQGQFELLTPPGVLQAIEGDGMPRYAVCHEKALASFLEDDVERAAATGLSLFLRLDPSCFLYYMTACDAEDPNEHVERSDVLDTKDPTKETVHSLLADASNGVSFKLTRRIKKGEKLLHYFPSQASILLMRKKMAQGGNAEGAGSGGVEGGGEKRQTTRAATRATAAAAAAMDTTS